MTFPLVEERNRGEHSPAEPILHELVQLRVGIQCRRRAHERVFLSPVDGIGEDVAHRLAQHLLFGHATNLQIDRLRANGLDDVMIEERDPALDRVRHLHTLRQPLVDPMTPPQKAHHELTG